MSTLHSGPYEIPSPEQMQVLIRQAHAERQAVIRAVFSVLFHPSRWHFSSWMGPQSEPQPFDKLVAC